MGTFTPRFKGFALKPRYAPAELPCDEIVMVLVGGEAERQVASVARPSGLAPDEAAAAGPLSELHRRGCDARTVRAELEQWCRELVGRKAHAIRTVATALLAADGLRLEGYEVARPVGG